ncbi:MAG: serine protease [Lachnospiraceae bacterium]|nr:serine protease [Lachnospiraceae bacterium]MBD5483238.1 serine protease [Lachnospiraceae bacterium]
MILGEFGNTKLDQYTLYVPDTREKDQKTEAAVRITDEREAVKVIIPERVSKNRPQRQNSTVVSAGQKDVRMEKSFEELAQMASSIVMIAVHDETGEVIGTGSGIMIGKSGYILTNHHVVARGRSYSVRIEDDETAYRSDQVIKYNSVLDMAVIRIDRKLTPLTIYDGRKKLVRGQKVVAIGSPLGLFNSVSDGIISGFRNIRDTDMIQFTAPISPGSSGGAVLNVYGEVIGISTAGIDSGQNINLAVGYEDILMFTKGFVG